jgi:ssDNA thymidine ADP-ribosyltransferase DarT-like protein
MPITLKRAKRHVSDWSKELAPYPTRSNWPAHLFHTCQLEVAAEIIKSGVVRCRNKVNKLICDVANRGALWNNPDAHDWVRLYFRPRNSFHFKTEGVKSRADPYRVDPHMSIPIAFAFDLQKVITLPTSSFVPGNFAKTATAPLTGDAAFDTMPFELIYHDSPLSQDRKAEVHNWRMSEVVVSDELSLSNLSFVICRTTHEERSLRYVIGNSSVPRIVVEQKGASLYEKRYVHRRNILVFWRVAV